MKNKKKKSSYHESCTGDTSTFFYRASCFSLLVETAVSSEKRRFCFWNFNRGIPRPKSSR